ncbi:MAG TPA: EAL domain-containing protein [Allosphingosinicella sp.]|jgi:diguanylate cyclase (GGDEF)-like protein
MLATSVRGGGPDAGPILSSISSYLPTWRVAVWVPLTYAAMLFLSVYLSSLADLEISPIFPAPAILVVAFLRNRRATWPVLLLLCAVAELTVNPNPDRVMAWINAFGNLSGALLVALLLSRFGDLNTWFVSARWFVLLVCSTLLSVAAANMAIDLILLASGHPKAADASLLLFYKIVTTDSISIVLVTPLILSWTEPALRLNLRSWHLVQAIALIAAVAGAAGLVFLFSDSVALLFLILPLLVLLTLRTGLPGATAGAVAIMGIGTALTAKGIGPIAAYPELGLGGRILFLQLYFLSAILSSIPIAVSLMIRAGLANEVKQQGAISDAALSNMAQGLSMFDSLNRLITCNRRFAELYDLPTHLTAPLTPLREIVEHHPPGDMSPTGLETYIRELLEIGDPNCSISELKLPSERIISIQRRALEDGSWVATHEDITERRRAEERISFLANHDPLTGLSNRTHFAGQLRAFLDRAEAGQTFALHALDLDRFKAVNDAFGHSAGDELLRQVSGRLRAIVRSGDVITRLGGDEFAILQAPLENPEEEASALAARIVAQLCEPFSIDGHQVRIGVSIGIALAPADASGEAELMQRSDLALYRAKADGRSRFCFYECSMNAGQQARRSSEMELQAALANGEFALYYQPIVRTGDQSVRSFEALLRWRHPTRGIIQPREFISIAEETKLIHALGKFVLKAACREAAAWPDDVQVAVNLSPVQFEDLDFVSTVRAALADSGLHPSRLELEITESLLLQKSEFVLNCLHEFRSMGISIAMDDFGTGYSSLSYLLSFPFDRIKIDRCFINKLTTSDNSRVIVRAAIGISKELGMASTAEGVETAEEYEALEAEGCTNVQGYYISPALAAHCVPAFLQRQLRRSPARLALHG